MSVVARGLGIGTVTPAAFVRSPLRDSVEIIESPEFKLRLSSWMLHRPPAGRLAKPIAVFAEALGEALITTMPFAT
jgi:DNA-binding transcriptional LysR family regulator